MTRAEIIANYMALSNWKPTSEEERAFRDWRNSIKSDEILAECLNPENHGEYNGRYARPSIGTLWLLSKRIKGERAAKNKTEYDEPESECFYCGNHGLVYDVAREGEYWYSSVRWRCKCISGNRVAKMHEHLTVDEPPHWITEVARKMDLTCPTATHWIATTCNRQARGLSLSNYSADIAKLLKEASKDEIPF